MFTASKVSNLLQLFRSPVLELCHFCYVHRKTKVFRCFRSTKCFFDLDTECLRADAFSHKAQRCHLVWR